MDAGQISNSTVLDAGRTCGRILSVSGSQASVGLPLESIDPIREASITVGKFLRIQRAKSLLIGMVTEVVAEGRHLERALEIAEGLASFPQETMLADRRAALEGFGLPLAEALALEAQAGPAVFEAAISGASRFAGGEGRGGAGAGV